MARVAVMLLMLTFGVDRCEQERPKCTAPLVRLVSPKKSVRLRDRPIDWVRRILRMRNRLSNSTMQENTQGKKGHDAMCEGTKGQGKGMAEVLLAVPSVVGGSKEEFGKSAKRGGSETREDEVAWAV